MIGNGGDHLKVTVIDSHSIPKYTCRISRLRSLVVETNFSYALTHSQHILHAANSVSETWGRSLAKMGGEPKRAARPERTIRGAKEVCEMNSNTSHVVWNSQPETARQNGAKGRLWILQRSKTGLPQNRSVETLLGKKSCQLEKRPGMPRTLRLVGV